MMKANKMKRSVYQRVVFAVVLVIFCIYSMTLVYPYVFAFNAALKESGRVFTRDMVSLAKPARWANFVDLFGEFVVNDSDYFKMTWNSIWRTTGGVVLSVIPTAMVTYVICYYKNPY